MNKIFFILVDAFSKWPEIHIVKNMLAGTTVEKCEEIFAQFGLPKTLVSDNGRTFISDTFQKFLEYHGIEHKFSAPFHPATNGQAERFVQMIKSALKKMNDEKNVNSDVNKILGQYRNMPHRTTGKSPAELFLGRKTRGRLDLLKPIKKIDSANINKHLKAKQFCLNQRVIARNYAGKQKWVLGKIIKINGRLHYEIQLEDGRVWVRHVNQIASANDVRNDVCERNLDYYVPGNEQPSLQNSENVAASDNVETTVPSIIIEESKDPVIDSSSTDALISNRPKRIVKPPDRYGSPVEVSKQV